MVPEQPVSAYVLKEVKEAAADSLPDVILHELTRQFPTISQELLVRGISSLLMSERLQIALEAIKEAIEGDPLASLVVTVLALPLPSVVREKITEEIAMARLTSNSSSERERIVSFLSECLETSCRVAMPG